MGAALKVTRAEHTGTELRLIASKCRDGAQVRRLLAIASVLEGRSRSEAAEQNGMYQPAYRLTFAQSQMPIDRMRSGLLTRNCQALLQASTIAS